MTHLSNVFYTFDRISSYPCLAPLSERAAPARFTPEIYLPMLWSFLTGISLGRGERTERAGVAARKEAVHLLHFVICPMRVEDSRLGRARTSGRIIKMRQRPGLARTLHQYGYVLLAATRISASTSTSVQQSTMNDLRKDQTLGRLPDTSPIFLPKNPSDRDISLINKMVREELYYPPARKRTPSHEQQRRTRVKQKKKLASP